LRPEGQPEAVAVTDSPFTGTRELIASFSICEVKDIDEAKAWARRLPPAQRDGAAAVP